MFVLNEHCQDTCDNREQGNTLNERSCQDHVGTDVVDRFWLAGNSLNRTFTDLTDTDTSANCSKPAPIAPPAFAQATSLNNTVSKSIIVCFILY